MSRRRQAWTQSVWFRMAILLVIPGGALIGQLPRASAQVGKKVFISVDMEGISGISGSDQLGSSGAEYGRSRKLMAEDTNAGLRGLLGACHAGSLPPDSRPVPLHQRRLDVLPP